MAQSMPWRRLLLGGLVGFLGTCLVPAFAAEPQPSGGVPAPGPDRAGRPDDVSPGDVKDTQLVAATRHVMQAVVAAARSNARLPANGRDRSVGRVARLRGDRLTERYFRVAARSALELPPEFAPRALACALGIALDESQLLRDYFMTGDFITAVESDDERQVRLDVLGRPTMLGRYDLTQHFVVSALLRAKIGQKAAEAAGLAKEMSDARRSGGFSFADMAANRAGIEFAGRLVDGQLDLEKIADEFSVGLFMPSIEALPEGIPWDEIRGNYLSDGGGKYKKLMRDVLDRVENLPVYRQVENP